MLWHIIMIHDVLCRASTSATAPTRSKLPPLQAGHTGRPRQWRPWVKTAVRHITSHHITSHHITFHSFRIPQSSMSQCQVRRQSWQLTVSSEMHQAWRAPVASGCAKEIRHWRPHWEANTVQAEAPSIARQSHHITSHHNTSRNIELATTGAPRPLLKQVMASVVCIWAAASGWQ